MTEKKREGEGVPETVIRDNFARASQRQLECWKSFSVTAMDMSRNVTKYGFHYF
jgi:hypothetical protein